MSADDGNAMDTMEARLLAASINEIRTEVRDMRTTLGGVQRALEQLVRIDTEQSNFRLSIGRAFDEIKIEREKRERIDDRIHLLEVDAPSYRELRRWVIGGVLTGLLALLGALFTIVFKVIISDPVERGFQRQPQSMTIPQVYRIPANRRVPLTLLC